MLFEAGTRVGDYEILSVLGAGGMGQVYSARNIISGRIEAMKILLPDFAAEPDLAARFTAEIRILAGLEHPDIAQLRTAFQFENRLVMVMEFVEGVTLEKRATESPIPLDDIFNYSSQVLAALSYAHSKGVTHRDIKPANIMITSHGQVKLMDFGIAKSTTDLQLTRPGTTMGSVYYMSPEQVRGGTVDARSDIYSFGVTLYEMLTGRRPFQADTAYTVLNAQLNQAPEPPAQINPSIPAELNGIVLHSMAKAPEGRFQTAEEFRTALRNMREPATATVRAPNAAPGPVLVTPAQSKPAKSRRGLWIGLGAAAAIVAMILAATFLPRMFSAHAGQKAAASLPANTSAAAGPATTAEATQPATDNASASSNPLATTAPAPTADSAGTPAAATAGPAMGGTSAAHPTSAISRRQTPSQPEHRPAYVPPAVQPSAPAATAINQPPAGSSRTEIAQARERMIQVGAQADAARSGVQQIRQQQQAQGLDIRGDILASMNRMNSYLNEANNALRQNDIQTANDNMDYAAKEISNLNTFLGR
ncbi:MAG: serine/threonine protein kinase [Acidobacteriaceae bacterium]